MVVTDAWHYSIDTAVTGAIASSADVANALVAPGTCPAADELSSFLSGAIYDELFEGFAAAKAAPGATLTLPRAQPITGGGAGAYHWTFEERIAADTKQANDALKEAEDRLDTLGGKLLLENSRFTSVEAGLE